MGTNQKDKPDLFCRKSRTSRRRGWYDSRFNANCNKCDSGKVSVFRPLNSSESGELDTDLWEFILANVRTPEERRGDMEAQLAANQGR